MKRPTEEKLQERPLPGKSLPTPRSPMGRPDWCGAVQPVVCPGFLPFGRRRSFDGGVEFWPLEVGRGGRDHLGQSSLFRLCLKLVHNQAWKRAKKRVLKTTPIKSNLNDLRRLTEKKPWWNFYKESFFSMRNILQVYYEFLFVKVFWEVGNSVGAIICTCACLSRWGGTAGFFICFALSAYLKVFSVSVRSVSAGDTQAIIEVQQPLPSRESFKTCWKNCNKLAHKGIGAKFIRLICT